MQSPKVIRPFSSSEFFRVERPRQRFQHARENLGWSLENGDLLFLQSKENPAAWKILDHHWFELIVSWWQYFQKKKKKRKKQLYVFGSGTACIVNSTRIHLTHLNAPETRTRGETLYQQCGNHRPLCPRWIILMSAYDSSRLLLARERPRYIPELCFLAWWKFNGYRLVSRENENK